MENSRKPNRFKIVFLPVFAIVFVIGWCLYVIGDWKSNQKYAKPVQSRVESDGVTLLPAVFEDEEEIAALN